MSNFRKQTQIKMFCFKRQKPKWPQWAQNTKFGNRIPIKLDADTTLCELMDQISNHESTPHGIITLLFKPKETKVMYFEVDIDHDVMYDNALRLERELKQLLRPFKPGFKNTAYGYPMHRKYGDSPMPGVVVAVHMSHLKRVEDAIRENYTTMYAYRVPIYIDEWD